MFVFVFQVVCDSILNACVTMVTVTSLKHVKHINYQTSQFVITSYGSLCRKLTWIRLSQNALLWVLA